MERYVEIEGKRYEVEREIEEDNFIITFVKQDKIENNLEGLYRTIGRLLYEHARTKKGYPK